MTPTITAESIRTLARRLDRAILADAERTADRLRDRLTDALKAAPAEVIAELEDAGDTESCIAWDDAVAEIDLRSMAKQAAQFLRDWAYAAAKHRSPRLCEDGRAVVAEFRCLRAAPEALRELAEVIERAEREDWDEARWDADEVCWDIGVVAGDLHGLDLDLLGGRWEAHARYGNQHCGCNLYLTVPIETTEALRAVLINRIERLRDIPDCLLTRPAAAKASA